jgi:hypothetical protein
MKLKAGDSIKIVVQDNKICLQKENDVMVLQRHIP